MKRIKKMFALMLSLLMLATMVPVVIAEPAVTEYREPPVIGDITMYAWCEVSYGDEEYYNFVAFNPNNMDNVEIVGSIPEGYEISAGCQVGDEMYAYVFGSTSMGTTPFMVINMEDFTVEPRGVFVDFLASICDMAYDHTTNTLYAIITTAIPGGSTSHLYTIDMTSGAAYPIGPCNSGNESNTSHATMYAICFDSEGTMYGIASDGWLYEIDPITSQTTPLHDLGFDNYWAGESMTADLETNTIYYHHIRTTSDNGFYAINPDSGAVTDLGMVRENGGQFYAFFIKQNTTYQTGDINMDGNISPEDALLALRVALGLVEIDEDAYALGDMDGDGVIMPGDALALLRIALGLSD